MNNTIFDVLNNVSEGIAILDHEYNIVFWSTYMENITKLLSQNVINKNIYDVMQSLNRDYFKKSVKSVLENGYKMFFSAAMHNDLVECNAKLNLKVGRIEWEYEKFLLIEFIDVTNQYKRIAQLKDYVNKLFLLNKELNGKEKVIKKLAYYDKLTGAANRTLFYRYAEKYINIANRNNSVLGLMFVDVDKFKSINDTYGHIAGDNVLVEVAGILKRILRKTDVVARFGGDEFLVLLPYINCYSNCRILGSRIVETCKSIVYNGAEIKFTLSIGFSFYPSQGTSIDDLISQSDKAMYVAKKSGGNCCFSYID